MRLSIACILICNSAVLLSQNLVQNPSFEMDTACTSGQWTSPILWPTFSYLTPDVFHENGCFPSTAEPFEGSKFGGFYYYPYIGFSSCEYMHNELTTNMTRDHIYYFEMQIRLGECSNYALDQVGVLFLQDLDTTIFQFRGTDAQVMLDTTPSIKSAESYVLNDTTRWMRVAGTYKSQFNESHLLIGFFKDVENLHSELVYEKYKIGFAYYYVDNVWLVDMQNILFDTVETCNVQLNYTVEPPDIFGSKHQIEWYDGDTSFQKTFDKSGQYAFTLFADTLPMQGKLTVRIDGDELEIDGEYFICPGDTLSIVPNNAFLFDHYLWGDSDTSTSILITEPGLINIEATNGCRTISKEIMVESNPCRCDIYIPNAISPNGDQVNDVFELYFKCFGNQINEANLKIYNRWGNLIFESSELNPIWDAKVNNQILSPQVLTWTLQYSITDTYGNEEPFLKSGHLLILR